MTHQPSNQTDLFDSFISNNPKLNRRLDKINKLVNWKAFENILKPIYSSSTGRPSYPLLLLFKCLLLQTWYALSDYALEEILDDRLSFRRFVELNSAQNAPDHSTFSRFRDQLIRLDLKEKLFRELNRQLEELGLVVKKGTLVDATVIESSAAKPNKESDGGSGKSSIDPEAKWTKKNGKFHFGYKAHLGVDQDSELIKKLELTPANIHDGEMLENIISKEEKWVFADKAYDSRKNDKILREQGIKNGILIKGARNRRLKKAEKLCNKVLSKFRSPVERIFGTFKRSYRYRRSKYIGLKKNTLELMLICFSYNLRRMEKLCS
jgi:IS5 family transposase